MVECSPKATRTYRLAMADGLVALQGMIDDLDAGPRENAHDNTENRDSTPHAFFGFGPV